MSRPRAVRSEALAKLARLSSSSSTPSRTDPDLLKLCEAASSGHPHHTPGAPNGHADNRTATGKVPMSFREYDVLVALCKAVPSIPGGPSGSRLFHQLSPYLSESCYQSFEFSPFFRDTKPSPWEYLTFTLADAIFQLGTKHDTLQDEVASTLTSYVDRCTSLVPRLSGTMSNIAEEGTDTETEHESSILALTSSMIGFLSAAAKNAGFWSHHERFETLSAFHGLLSQSFLLNVEAACSRVRGLSVSAKASPWKLYLKNYNSSGEPFGATLLRRKWMSFVEVCAALMITDPSALAEGDLLAAVLSQRSSVAGRLSADAEIQEKIADIATSELLSLNEGFDYVQMASSWERRQAHGIRGSCLISLSCCALVNSEILESDLFAWLEATLLDPQQVIDTRLACAALQCLALLATASNPIAASLSRSIPKFLNRNNLSPEVAKTAAQSLTIILHALPRDALATTLYTLGNSLSTTHPTTTKTLFSDEEDLPDHTERGQADGAHITAPSSVSLTPSEADKVSTVHINLILAIVTIAQGCEDSKMNALAISMLIQKVGRVGPAADLKIIEETAVLAAQGQPAELRALLRLYTRLTHEALTQRNDRLLQVITQARSYLSQTLKGGTPLYEIYLSSLLESIIAIGETQSQTSIKNTEFAAQEISALLKPLALLAVYNVATEGIELVESFPAMQRDAWYNIVIHGFSASSKLGQKHLDELRVLARYSSPLVGEERIDRLESEVELNVVLRRGKSTSSTTNHRKEMIEMFPRCESDIKSLSHSEVIFIKTAHLIETLRAIEGECTRILAYFVEPELRDSPMGNCMAAVALDAVQAFLKRTNTGKYTHFTAPFAAQQLSTIFEYCCHPVDRVQRVAYQCADSIINEVPSALCQRSSIFALLDLLTIMWSSCLESDIDEYTWKSTWTSPDGTTRLQLSDDTAFRKLTLRRVHQKAREWMSKAINTSPLDVKGLLQTYLSDYGDDETFGHMSLGRSFASEMGAFIPSTDQRLSAVESDSNVHINTASDFIAQYTTRQEYRYTDPLRVNDMGMNNTLFIERVPVQHHSLRLQSTEEMIEVLTRMEDRVRRRDAVPMHELRDVLRRAASLLCTASDDNNDVLDLFVRIPYANFSKQAIKLGLSLWMGVIKENPRMEPRLLVEIMENWISTVHGEIGVFSPKLKLVDPFFLKEEFAPSDANGIAKAQRRAHDSITPHFRILEFLASHYSATRRCSLFVERMYHRFIQITLRGLRNTTSHPLLREIHFHAVLLALKILRFNTSLSTTAGWRLLDDLLSVGLAWFQNPQRWSYGGNRLQLKAEAHLLADVVAALNSVNSMSRSSASAQSKSSLQGRKPLDKKETLLKALLADEQSRLLVWLFPLDDPKRHHFPSSVLTEGNAVDTLLDTAWAESPSLAIQIGKRFKKSDVLSRTRQYILRYPQKSLDEPDALRLLLGAALPNDVASQLKYFLYWAPVDPISAVTYFLPAYRNHPFVLQYALRALESHSIDITFFYVPQIVQTLRYDSMGYVTRYIIETGTFSQLFAHQIIWNMKANAYKDEDATDPDPVKPTLDKVMGELVSSFSGEDKAFYEREFEFFNEVTDISGKLRPFIKKPKPEKKQKIEEELRKIQVDVGVYLPSNPDGVVVGIDRSSGKPLQSHAKAPYMATFRIRRERLEDEMDQPDKEAEEQKMEVAKDADEQGSKTYEAWQSAIFKVGDDCRQDVLALQMIAAFRGIFQHVGLPVYVFPYRVTATAPGCGVIDVLPNSISRDMLGREAVNGLYPWFLSKFGSEDAPAFQMARANFVKSMAAYSIISYLLQFKDRHNGNIMFDDQGHVLHIDFGFCFDIAPGGVRFERAPFKLTKEMIAVMGGSNDTQSFRSFEELCVKVFLASRPYVDTLAHIVMCMLDSGLPCFKPETIQHFKERFVLEKSEREAANFVRFLVKKSYAAVSTKGYDQFQLLTNGIPY